MKKFAFYVSNNGTRVIKFLNQHKNGNTNIIHQIKFVLIDNVANIELQSVCGSLGIILYEVDLDGQEDKNNFISNMFFKYLNKHKINYAFVFANKKLTGKVLTNYKNKIINFHPSILPCCKGLNAIDKSLKSDAFLLGNTAHFITNEIDRGSIIMQNIFPRINFENYDDILDKQLIMLWQIIVWINNDRLIIDKNNSVHIKNANYKVKDFIPNVELKESR